MARLIIGWVGVGLGALGTVRTLQMGPVLSGAWFLVLFAAGGLALARRHWPAVRFAAAGVLLFGLLGVMTVGTRVLPGAILLAAAAYEGFWRRWGPSGSPADRS